MFLVLQDYMEPLFVLQMNSKKDMSIYLTYSALFSHRNE